MIIFFPLPNASALFGAALINGAAAPLIRGALVVRTAKPSSAGSAALASFLACSNQVSVNSRLFYGITGDQARYLIGHLR